MNLKLYRKRKNLLEKKINKDLTKIIEKNQKLIYQ